MEWHFRYSEFTTLEGNIFQPDIPTIDKVIKNFMVPLNEIRAELKQPIYIRSCYRPKSWELKQGRDGSSQHCFSGEGACDVSLTPRPDYEASGWKDLFEALDRKYGRICYYPELKFFHVDSKGFQKLYFINDNGWKQLTREELLSKIPD